MEFREHPIYKGYPVREDGKIFSPKTGKELYKQKINSGYWVSHFRYNNKRKAITVHRFVAETWVPNPDNKPQVNHKDGIKDNSHPDNLQWCTQSENMKHAFSAGLSENTRERARERMSIIGTKYAKINGQLLNDWKNRNLK